MDTFFGIGVIATFCYGAYCLACRIAQFVRAGARSYPNPLEAARARQRMAAEHQRRQRLARLNLLARNLQLALLQLKHAADFRRAASFATQAAAVPAAFRLRQFRRFRGQLIAHMANRLSAGGDGEVLTQSLAELLQALGVPAFEADYLRTEAERLLTVPRTAATPPYAQRLGLLQRDHEQRKAALEGLAGLDAERREQLLEQEETRFQEALQALGNNDEPQAL